MRLIDADALTEKIKDWIEYCTGHTDIVHEIMRGVFESVVDDIKDSPTIDAAPVRRGEWVLRRIGAGHFWECSACHTNPCIYVTEHTHFCPNCGADMRRGDG